MAGEMVWGKNKGCDFLTKACKDDENTYREFPKNNGNSCSFDYLSKGESRIHTVADDCSITTPTTYCSV